MIAGKPQIAHCFAPKETAPSGIPLDRIQGVHRIVCASILHFVLPQQLHGSPPLGSQGAGVTNVYDTDVLIIGAGLAGSVLAYRLRQHGLRVIIAGRGRLDTLDKPCVGALAESVEGSFEGIYGPGSLGSIGLHTASRRIVSCVGASVQGDAPFATVPRKRLDDYCRARASSAGRESFSERRPRASICRSTKPNCATCSKRAGSSYGTGPSWAPTGPTRPRAGSSPGGRSASARRSSSRAIARRTCTPWSSSRASMATAGFSRRENRLS